MATKDIIRLGRERLGMTQQVYARHESGVVKIDTRTALACAALAAGLKPWTTA